MRFAGKVAAVTGGGSGIGLEAARRLVAEGARVVINGRSLEKLKVAAKEIDSTGKLVAFFDGDIGLIKTAQGLVDLATSKFGGLDILINNAGIFAPKPFLDTTEADYGRFVDIILKGKFFAAQAAARAMKKRGGGAIVQTGSMWALQAIGATPSAAYSVANAGVHQLTKNLALELAVDKIRINTVAPAVVETPVYSTFMTQDQISAALPQFAAIHPLGRNGKPADVVNALLFLASEEASWITGTILSVDGGVMAGRN
jgi:NAD(P)-dependent dehydrogenase (short-subunit alcohol dehydrogenase family)